MLLFTSILLIFVVCFFVILKDGLSGSTPLHYVVEKKSVELLAWFLGLIRHVCAENAQHSRPAYQIINARTSSNATAVTIAWSLQIDEVERVRMVKLLLASGAELSTKCDISLRRDLLKVPEVLNLVICLMTIGRRCKT